ncbi:hypothetical protein PAXINDRAFT_182151 [Paxillus involutus ATCC 200175]|uniref:Unplaced genomic scaffold PAXINscaffold_164, whole genome shotgun sequence n=1 Tax=Paxillus involutus ATCC 200175 TaxID=664439 RepID=A0A0C9TQ03_PAXIN|nr:hypothetical protein PAXINDRAFT_182151 [Paxillus involutus ATCC 200175]
MCRRTLAAAGITGAIEAATGSTQNTINLANTLHKVSISIFPVLCILVAFQMILLVCTEVSCTRHRMERLEQHTASTCCGLSNDLVKQNNENWWHPLATLTEFVAVVMSSARSCLRATSSLHE